MNDVEKALKIAYAAHYGQTDKAGQPYILHPVTVALSQTTDAAKCVALLHDVVEDTDYTIDDLKADGFPQEVIEAVQLLTHNKSENYFDYVMAIAENDLAKSVKLADLAHNSDLSRLPNVTEKDIKRVEKYKKAIEYLQSK